MINNTNDVLFKCEQLTNNELKLMLYIILIYEIFNEDLLKLTTII